MARAVLFVTILMVVTAMLYPCAARQLPRVGEEEIELGKEASAAAEKEHQLIDDPELKARVLRLGEPLASVANSVEIPATYGSSQIVNFSYTFKIVSDDDVNAFSIPGGHIYVFKGLIDFCESDHELAAVLAHEIAHAAHHHMVQLIRERSRLQSRMALVLVASLLADINAEDMSNVMAGAQFYTTARVSGYGQRAETDADLTAIDYLIRAKFNPVGMLTFLERLAEHPDLIEWGIFRTHPRASERVKAVKERLTQLGIDINRRDVTTSMTAVVRPIVSDGMVVFEVVVGRTLICRTLDEQRAHNLVEQLNRLLDDGLQFRELKLDEGAVLARGRDLIRISEEDASLARQPASKLAEDALDGIRHVLFKQMVNDLW